MKRVKKKNKNYFFLLGMMVIVALLSISVGYASLSTTLTVNGMAAFKPVGMIRVMSINDYEFSNATSIDSSYTKDSVSVLLDINQLDGTATYRVNITNLGETNKTVSRIINETFSNNDITYYLDGLTLGERISPHQSVDFNIVFHFKDGVSAIDVNRLNAKLKFIFDDYQENTIKEAYFIQYNGSESLMGFTKSSIKQFKRNTTITKDAVLAKSGVTVVSTSSTDTYPSDTEVYAWLENGTLYWWSEADVVYFHPKTIKAFNNYTNLTSVDLNGTSTVYVENFSHFFDNDRKLTEIKGIIDTSGLVMDDTITFDYGADTNDNSSAETGLAYMFNDCNALTSVDLSQFDTSNATDMKRMFGGCKALTNINVSNFDTSNVKSMYWMFRACNNVTDLDLTAFDTSNVLNMNGMFLSSIKLKTVTFGDYFDTSNVLNANRMFENIASLRTIYASRDFEMNANLLAPGMFSGNTNLVGGRDEAYATSFSNSHKDASYAKIASPTQSGYFTHKNHVTIYTITYDLGGGSASNPVTYTRETATFTLSNPTKNGYTFIGWTGSNGETPQTTVTIELGSTGNKTYTANYERSSFTITYNLDGGSASNPTSYETTSSTFTLNNPVKEGYTFVGWTGSNGYTPQTTVTIPTGTTGDLSFTANYVRSSFTITYNLDGGSASNPTSYNSTDPAFTLNNPTKNGYTFTGWTGSNGSTMQTTVTIPTGTTGDLVFTAHYVRSSFTITYNLDGGSASNPTSYNSTDPAFTLNNPIKNGYTFTGWTGSNGSTMQTTVTIPTGTTGDLVFTAHYEQIQATQTFTLAGPCVFNGKNGTVTGSGCEAYSGQSYINTGISLYSQANYLKDYEISFTVDAFNPSGQDSGTSQATLMNTKYESSSVSYPGLTIRKESGRNNFEITQTIEGSKVSKTFAISTPFTFKIIRRNSIIYYSVNNGDEVLLQNMSNFTHYFNTPVTFGASLDANGNPFRQAKVTISNMSVILY